MDLVTLAKAKKYTDDSIEGTSGVLKGKNCTIKSIEKIDGVNTVTFQWTADDGTVKTSTMQVADGIAGVGTDGKSAYQVWLDLGNSGTEQDFLDSLKGEKGADGTMTFADLTEEQKESLKGEPGADGTDGASAYEIWIDEGNSGTEQDFLDSLKGEPGEKGEDGSKNIDDENVSTDTTWSSEKIASELGGKADIPIIENGKDVVQHKITKNRSITELEAYTDRNGGTGYKIDDLYLTYDCEKLAKGIDDWLANKGITPVKGETYEDIAQIQVYNPSAGGYGHLSTHIKFDNTTYLGYYIKYNDTDYTIISVQYDHTNGKTSTTFSGLNVFNIAKIIPELAGYYIQSDILDVLHNWFELYKPIGLEDTVGLYSKREALLNQDLTVNTSIDSKTVGAFDLGNIVSLMTSPLQKLLFSVDSEGNNLKAFANDEKKRTTALSNGLFGNNLLASKNIFATLNDMSTLPTPPDEALGIWTVVPDAPGQPETSNVGGTLIIAHITSDLYSQTINYIGTRIAIYVTQGAIYYALGYGGKYYPTASWTPPSGGTFRWYKIASTLV